MRCPHKIPLRLLFFLIVTSLLLPNNSDVLLCMAAFQDIYYSCCTSSVNYKAKRRTAPDKKLLLIPKRSHQVKPRGKRDFYSESMHITRSSIHASYLFMGLESLEFCCSSFLFFLLVSLNLCHDGFSYPNLVYSHLRQKSRINYSRPLVLAVTASDSSLHGQLCTSKICIILHWLKVCTVVQ